MDVERRAADVQTVLRLCEVEQQSRYIPSSYKQSFCFSNAPVIKAKELFVSTASRPLVSTYIFLGDISDVLIFLLLL